MGGKSLNPLRLGGFAVFELRPRVKHGVTSGGGVTKVEAGLRVGGCES